MTADRLGPVFSWCDRGKRNRKLQTLTCPRLLEGSCLCFGAVVGLE